MVTPAHRVPPVCRCGNPHNVHSRDFEADAAHLRMWRDLAPSWRGGRWWLSAWWRCPARPGATRPANRPPVWVKSWGMWKPERITVEQLRALDPDRLPR